MYLWEQAVVTVPTTLAGHVPTARATTLPTLVVTTHLVAVSNFLAAHLFIWLRHIYGYL